MLAEMQNVIVMYVANLYVENVEISWQDVFTVQRKQLEIIKKNGLYQ